MKGYVTFTYAWNKLSHHGQKLLQSGCIIVFCITSFASFSLLLILLDLEHGGVWCNENAKATDILQPGLSSDPRQGIRGPKYLNQTKNARRSQSERLNDYLTIHISAESDFGFLNLSRFYSLQGVKKNLDPCLMGHKGCQKWHEDKSSVSVLQKF